MRKMMLAVAVAAVVGASAWAMATQGRDAGKLPVREQLGELLDANAYDAKYDARVALQAARTGSLDVGDPDSFGRTVRWLGLMSSPTISLRGNCDPQPGEAPDPLCSVVDPAALGTQLVSHRDIARMTLPPRSTHSLLCHWLTPTVNVTLANYSGFDNRNARITLYPSMTIENAALNATGLVDPITGEPLNGKLEVAISSNWTTAMLDSGEQTLHRNTATRTCIGGYVSRRALVEGYGLSERQAQEFFANPTTIRLNLDVRSMHVADALVNYSVRVLGD